MGLPGKEKTKDTTADDSSEFGADFDVHCNSKGRNAWSWKIKLLVGFLIILTLLYLAVSFFLEFTKSTKTIASVKTKRFAKMDDYYEESENTETVQNNIHIVPEGRLEGFDRRANHHPNHRYLEIEPDGTIYKKIMRDLYDESGWSPKPFNARAEEYFDSVQKILSKERPKNKSRGSKFPNSRPKGLEGGVKFRGFYDDVPLEEDPNKNSTAQNFYYSKEINNLMQNYSDNEGEENTAVKKAFKSHGAPFRVAIKDVPERERLNMHRTTPSKPKLSWFKERFKKKRPLTILLDIYPMTEADDYINKEKHKFNQFIKPPGKFSKLEDTHPKGKFLFPRERRNGIIMKLNLYSKERNFSRHQNSKGDVKEATRSNDIKRAEDRTFGWMSKKREKKLEPKTCSLMALRPHGKHVTAKWKDENGEWIHAKHIWVKYLKQKE